MAEKTITAQLVMMSESDLVDKQDHRASVRRRGFLFPNGTLVYLRADGTIGARKASGKDLRGISVLNQQVAVPFDVHDDAYGIVTRQERLSQDLPARLSSTPVPDPLGLRRDEPEMAHATPLH